MIGKCLVEGVKETILFSADQQIRVNSFIMIAKDAGVQISLAMSNKVYLYLDTSMNKHLNY